MSHQDLAPLPDGYAVEPFDSGDADALIDLWSSERAMPAEEAGRRVHEALFVGRGPGGDLVGVCTVFLRRSRQLGTTFWYVRVFVAADHRMGNLAFRLLLAARDELRRRWDSGAERRAAGVMTEVQNRGLGGHLANATWRSDFTFVGQSAEGYHMRAHYFPGALAPAPPA